MFKKNKRDIIGDAAAKATKDYGTPRLKNWHELDHNSKFEIKFKECKLHGKHERKEYDD